MIRVGGVTLGKGSAMEYLASVKPAPLPATTSRPVLRSEAGPVATEEGSRAVTATAEAGTAANNPAGYEDPAAVSEAVKRLEARLPINLNLDFSFDESTRRTVVRAVSRLTGETVIEVPTEKMLKLVRGLREELGIAVDQRA